MDNCKNLRKHCCQPTTASHFSTNNPTQPLYARQDGVTLLDDGGVASVLGVGAVRLDGPVDAVDRARQPAGGDKARKIPVRYTLPQRQCQLTEETRSRERERKQRDDSRIEPLARDAERGTEVVHRDAPVTLE